MHSCAPTSQVALQPFPGLAEAPNATQRPGQHLLKHAVTAAVRERAAAQLGGTDEGAAAAVCALRQVGGAAPSLEACLGAPWARKRGRKGVCACHGGRGPTARWQPPFLAVPTPCAPWEQPSTGSPAPLPLQPKLRQVFESVFDCSTASGNNQVRAWRGLVAAKLPPCAPPHGAAAHWGLMAHSPTSADLRLPPAPRPLWPQWMRGKLLQGECLGPGA